MLTNKYQHISPMSRRGFVQGTAAVGGAALLSGGWAREAFAQDRSTTMVIAAPATPQSLDHEFDVSLGTIDSVGALYDNLLGYEKVTDPEDPDARREDISVRADKPYNLALTGKLAEKWELTEDGQTARFWLREGVKSNWGNELTAEDVRWTWVRKLHLTGLGPFQTSVINIKEEDQIKAEGRYVVSFHSPKPSPLLLKQMVNLSNPVYDATKCKEVSSSDDSWARKFLQNESAGFGPYKMKQIVRGQQAVFEAREDYYLGAPFMKTVIMREVPTSAARVSLLERGAVDIAQFLQPLEYVSLKGPGVAVDSVAASFSIWLELNAKMPPFDNPDVRRAINYALPKDEVLKTVYQGLADKQIGCIPKIYPMFNSEFWNYDQDLDKARELLGKAGHGDGFNTSLSYNAGDPAQEQMAILFQTSLKEIGVELQLNKVPAATFYNQVTNRSEPIIFYLDSPWVPDPGYSTQLYFHSKSYVNYSNYKNDKVDALIEQGLQTTDTEERRRIYDEVQKIVMDEVPWGFIAYPRYNLARKADLKGFTYYTSNNLRFQDFHREGA
jgi:peptide/nickel transport system substrate-binding protein